MAEGNQIVIHNPVDGETLKQYLGRYTDEDIKKIFEIPEILSQYCSILVSTPWLDENEQNFDDISFQKVWEIIRCKDNFNCLLHHIEMWESTRIELLKLLSDSVNTLGAISKWCSGGRFIGCVIESGSTIGGLLSQDTGYASYSNFLLRTATVFGFVALGSTVIEYKMLEDRFKKITKLIERDQQLFANIRKWFQQTQEIEKAASNCFPFDLTETFVEAFTSIRNNTNSIQMMQKYSFTNDADKLVNDPAKTSVEASTSTEDSTGSTSFIDDAGKRIKDPDLIKTSVEDANSIKNSTSNTSIKEEADKLINDPDRAEVLKTLLTRAKAVCQQIGNVKKEIEKLTNFIRCHDFNELFKRILIGNILSLDPVAYDVSRMALQKFYSPVEYLLCQSVKALLPGDQHLKSAPVWGRIVLNGLTILNSVSSFWNDEVKGIPEMISLKKQLEGELNALRRMVKVKRRSVSLQ